MADDVKPTVVERRGSAPRAHEPVEPRGPAPPTATAGRYAEGDEIARGGMGRVVDATDGVLGRTVAVKQVLSRDPEILRRFARETRITARLEHPSIVPVYDAGTSPDGTPFYVMRKVTGRPLEQLVAEAATLAARLALVPHVLASAQAVAHAHRRGVVHRDLKPSNILVGELGETVVIDWGLAKVIGEPEGEDDREGPSDVTEMAGAGDSLRTRIGQVFGTPGFMSPEQLRGDPVDERGDVYALGATLYYLLSQHSPHEAASGTAMMGAALVGPPRPLAAIVDGVPPELSTIVDTALAHEPAQRYVDAAALAAELQRFLTGQLVASHRYSRRERLRRFVRRHRLPLAIGTLAVVALVAFAVVAISRVTRARDAADTQATLATSRLRDAEAARASEAERADQLLLLQARTLVETNPTGAVALVKQLRQPAERWQRLWRNARGIAAGARSAGIAHGMAGPPQAMSIRFSPDGLHAVVFGDDHVIYAYDLVHATSRVVATVDAQIDQVAYLDADRLIMWSYGQQPPRLTELALATGAPLRSLTLASQPQAVVVTPGVILWSDAQGILWRISTAPGDLVVTPVPLDTPVHVSSLVASHGRAQVAFAAREGIGVIDPATLAVRMLSTSAEEGLSWSADDQLLAVTGVDRVGKIAVRDGTTTWFPRPRPLITAMTHDRLVEIGAGNMLRVEDHGVLEPRFLDPIDLGLGVQLTRGGLVVTASGRRLVLVDGLATMLVLAPVEGFERLGASPLSPYILAARAGRIYVWDLTEILPAHDRFDGISSFVLESSTTAIVAQNFTWSWLDLATRKATPLVDLSPTLDVHFTTDPDLALGVDVGAHDRALAFHRDGTVERIDDHVVIVDLVGDGYIVCYGDVRIDRTTHQAFLLFQHAARPSSLSWASGKPSDALVVLFEDGHVWRRSFAGHEDATKLPTDGFILRMAHDGGVMLPRGDRVVRWAPDGTQTELARLPDEIVSLSYNHGLVIATTRDHAGWVVDPQGRLASRVPSGVRSLQLAEAADLAVFIDASGAVRVSDLIAGEIWRLSPLDGGSRITSTQISPDGTLVGWVNMTRHVGLSLWPTRLPTSASETASWLDHLTNATAELGETALLWPVPTKPPTKP
ncbi:MAG: serine/threonine-protein kinase [Proteobacteria bacterium]|nr:serine/threonine-protein kinase [Pseudomonadota bacterium]